MNRKQALALAEGLIPTMIQRHSEVNRVATHLERNPWLMERSEDLKIDIEVSCNGSTIHFQEEVDSKNQVDDFLARLRVSLIKKLECRL